MLKERITDLDKVENNIHGLQYLKSQIFERISPKLIPVWEKLLNSGDEKIQLGAVKLAIENLIPKSIIHGIIQKIMVQGDEGETNRIHGLLTALPAFGDFLRWKQLQDSGKVVDAEIIPDKQV